MLFFILITGTIILTQIESAHVCRKKRLNWDYRDNGPSTWYKIAPQCKGANQSPIDIVTTGCGLTKANYKNYVNKTNYSEKPKESTYKLINNGHSLEIKLPENTTYEVRKGEHVYVPIHMNIHFDSRNRRGSEHSINGKKYFGEIQVVHRNKKYRVEDICNHPHLQTNAVLILAMFVDLRKNDNTDKRTLYGFEEEYRNIMGVETSIVIDIVSQGAEKIPNAGQFTRIDAFPLSWLFPHSKREGAIYNYINYFGSVSTPPCFEIIDWIVFTGATLVTEKEVGRKMLHVLDNTEKQMSGCSRPAQDLNGRNVYGVEGKIK